MRRLLAVLLLGLVAGCGNAPATSPVASAPATPPGPAAIAASAPVAVPVRVTIPDLDAQSELITLDLDGAGKLGAPPVDRPELAGWYVGAARPGAVGPAVIAAHVNGRVNGVSTPGLFAHLGDLQPGARVHVTRADASVVTFQVVRVERHDKDAFPTAEVYGNTAGPELRLITCGGEFNQTTRHYEDNVIVFATLV